MVVPPAVAPRLYRDLHSFPGTGVPGCHMPQLRSFEVALFSRGAATACSLGRKPAYAPGYMLSSFQDYK